MTAEQQLERVRMCLAEAGYDPADVYLVQGRVAFFRLFIPHFVAWKVSVLCGMNGEMCWPCVRELGWQESPIGVTACGHPVDPFCAEDAELVQ